MKVVFDERAKKFLDKLGEQNSSRALGYFKLLEKYGFTLPDKYLKKIGYNIWELRPGRLRLFLYIKTDKAILVHAIVKKSQKIQKKDFETIEQRIKDRQKIEKRVWKNKKLDIIL